MVPLPRDTYDVALDRYIVGREIVEGWRAGGGAVVEREAGMVPWAANGLTDQHPLIERCSVMRAPAAHREPVWLDMNQQHRLSKRVTHDELTSADAADLDTLRQIRPGQLIGLFAHSVSYAFAALYSSKISVDNKPDDHPQTTTGP
jgi:hypothetical protein